MDSLTHSDSIIVARTPEELYELVSDITNMGEWSPICKACWWEEGEGPRVGAWFGGRNELPERTWETRSEVVAADPGREFAFVVNGTIARWGYTFTPVDGSREQTELTESWEFLPGGQSQFREWFGDDADAQIADRYAKAKTGIPDTLAAIKRAAETPREGVDDHGE